MPGSGNSKTPLVSFEDAQKLAIAATEKNATLRERVLECLKRYTNGNPAAGGMGGICTKRTMEDLEEHSTALKRFKDTTADVRLDLEAMDMLCSKVRLEPLIKVKELQVEEVKEKIELEKLKGKNAYDADFRVKEAHIRGMLGAANAKEVARMAEEAAANAAQRKEHSRAKEQAAKDADVAREQAAKDADLTRDKERLTLEKERLALQLDFETKKAALLPVAQAYPIPAGYPIIILQGAPLGQAYPVPPGVDIFVPPAEVVDAPAVGLPPRDPVFFSEEDGEDEGAGEELTFRRADLPLRNLIMNESSNGEDDEEQVLAVGTGGAGGTVGGAGGAGAGGAGGAGATKTSKSYTRGKQNVQEISMGDLFPGAKGQIRTILVNPDGEQMFCIIDIIQLVGGKQFDRVYKRKSNYIWSGLDGVLKERLTSISSGDQVRGGVFRFGDSKANSSFGTNLAGVIVLIRARDNRDAKHFRGKHPDFFKK